MPKYCPYESGLECSDIDQVEEFYKQMETALNNGKTEFYLVADDRCPCYASDCARLLAYREKMQNSK